MNTVLTGITVLALATIALPALFKFFSWATPQIGSGGSGGGSGLSTFAAMGAQHLGAGGGAQDRDPAQLQESRMENSGPGGTGMAPPGAALQQTPASESPGLGKSGLARGAQGGVQAGAEGAGQATTSTGAGAAGAAGPGGVAAAAGPAAAAAMGAQAVNRGIQSTTGQLGGSEPESGESDE